MNRRNFFTTVGALAASLALPSVDERALRFKNYTRIYDGGIGGIGISKEALEDIKRWGVDEIDEQTRKEICLSFG